MARVLPVEVVPLSLARFAPLIGDHRYDSLRQAAEQAKAELGTVTVWNVNSTAAGGGVAEMLRVIVGYALDAGVDVRWCVITGDSEFFGTTKRIHNQLHGFPGGGELRPADVEHYRLVTDALGEEMAAYVRRGDVVILHDPQTAAMAPRIAAAGAHVLWRCHVGADRRNEWTEAAWDLLRPHLEQCQAFVFSRRSYAPEWLPAASIMVIPPSIDPFAPKNEGQSLETSSAILHEAGVTVGRIEGAARFTRRDGTPGTIAHRATVIGEGPIDLSEPLVVQVSRWDRLKDMAGVMSGFVGGLHDLPAHLALVGPEAGAVGDDPEGADVLAECITAWQGLSSAMRRRVSIVTLPMDDADENAAMVNAIQRRATIVVQKSLAEGFGLTVAEAMWKGRAVIASAVGGIVDQVTPGTGILLDNPSDLEAYGAALSRLLGDGTQIAAFGEAAHRRVLGEFLGDQHLIAYAKLMKELSVRGR